MASVPQAWGKGNGKSKGGRNFMVEGIYMIQPDEDAPHGEVEATGGDLDADLAYDIGDFVPEVPGKETNRTGMRSCLDFRWSDEDSGVFKDAADSHKSM